VSAPAASRVELTFDDAVSAAERDHIGCVIAGFDLPDGLAARVEVLAGGASNANYLLTLRDARRLVLRVASATGERLGNSRWQGVAAHQTAAAAGLAPEILAVTLPAGHLLVAYEPGPVLDAGSIRQGDMLERVARTLRACHESGTIRGGWSVFDDVRRYTGLARSEGLELPADIDELTAIADDAEAAFARAQTPDRLCHNDLQLQNFIIQPDRLMMLDWEWAGMGNVYFDLGGTTINAELGRDEVRRLAQAYFEDDDPAHEARVELMMFMSALREANWAVIAAPVLALDWDYEAWAREYYGRCRRAMASGRIAAALETAA
jgi:thiamine kinase-like enzyme